ncbi:hypothetical protein AB1Y20_011268 [Prymnesium parvum]|uniref:NAD(P)(+)--arginine ADP-ribosyltransferase n=1 Tax=Prymnesium parvum TaxID=97485 RepID=A0AB34IME6_PRYPA
MANDSADVSWMCLLSSQFKPYDAATSAQIESAYQSGESEVTISISGKEYVIHFDLMRQQQVSNPNRTRQVRRKVGGEAASAEAEGAKENGAQAACSSPPATIRLTAEGAGEGGCGTTPTMASEGGGCSTPQDSAQGEPSLPPTSQSSARQSFSFDQSATQVMEEEDPPMLPPAAIASLVANDNNPLGDLHLRGEQLVLGSNRNPKADLQIDDLRISSTHAVFMRTADGSLAVSDHSTNGVFINRATRLGKGSTQTLVQGDLVSLLNPTPRRPVKGGVHEVTHYEWRVDCTPGRRPALSPAEEAAKRQRVAEGGGACALRKGLTRRLEEDGGRTAEQELAARLSQAMLEAEEEGKGEMSSRFVSTPNELLFGNATQATWGLEEYMCVTANEVRGGMLGGVDAIRREVEAHGSAEDKECLHYVLHEEAGSSEKEFQNGLRRDCGPDGQLLPERRVAAGGRGMRFADFVAHEHARLSKLEDAHVLALRLYTTAAFKSLNTPLRDHERFKNKEKHKLAVTVAFIREAVLKLRSVGAASSSAMESQELWRGMRDVCITDTFFTAGGTELAPMSTTYNLSTAVQYGKSMNSVLLRIHTENALQRGADITFLSAFPREREMLYPPLTFLSPLNGSKPIKLHVGEFVFTVVEVKPHL